MRDRGAQTNRGDDCGREYEHKNDEPQDLLILVSVGVPFAALRKWTYAMCISEMPSIIRNHDSEYDTAETEE